MPERPHPRGWPGGGASMTAGPAIAVGVALTLRRLVRLLRRGLETGRGAVDVGRVLEELLEPGELGVAAERRRGLVGHVEAERLRLRHRGRDVPRDVVRIGARVDVLVRRREA